jgi:hypothetical protein
MFHVGAQDYVESDSVHAVKDFGEKRESDATKRNRRNLRKESGPL